MAALGVEKILDSKFQGRKLYLVKWQGYSSAEKAWVPEGCLEPIQGWLKDYDRAEEGKKRIEELEEVIQKLKKNETKAVVTSYDECRVERANKKLKVEVDEQKLPQNQSMINDKYHFFMDPHSNLSSGSAANVALNEEISRLHVDIRGKNNDIEDLKREMNKSVNDLQNELERESALEASMIAKDDAIRKLELQNGKLMADCNELEVTQGRLFFENKLNYEKLESVNHLEIKLAKVQTMLQKAMTQLGTQAQHEQSLRASEAKTSQLETEKTELQIALAVSKEESGELVRKNSQFQKDNAELQNRLDANNQDRELLSKRIAEKEKCHFYKKKIDQLYKRVEEAKSEIQLGEEQKVQLREKCKKLDEKYEELLSEIQSKNPDHETDCNYKKMLTEMEEAFEEAKRQHEQELHMQELKIFMLNQKLKMGHFGNALIDYSDSD